MLVGLLLMVRVMLGGRRLWISVRLVGKIYIDAVIAAGDWW